MIPIHELLNRVRWDEEFGNARFEIEYYDRVERRPIRVALADIDWSKDDPYFVHIVDIHGETHPVPMHRIKSVYRDGCRIWHREH